MNWRPSGCGGHGQLPGWHIPKCGTVCNYFYYIHTYIYNFYSASTMSLMRLLWALNANSSKTVKATDFKFDKHVPMDSPEMTPLKLLLCKNSLG